MLTDGQTDGRTNKRMETCTPKSPMLKQVQQKVSPMRISSDFLRTLSRTKKWPKILFCALSPPWKFLNDDRYVLFSLKPLYRRTDTQLKESNCNTVTRSEFLNILDELCYAWMMIFVCPSFCDFMMADLFTDIKIRDEWYWYFIHVNCMYPYVLREFKIPEPLNLCILEKIKSSRTIINLQHKRRYFSLKTDKKIKILLR